MAMGFSDIRGSFIWLLLVDLLSNAQGQQVELSSSDVYCPVERLESRLASIEDQVNLLQRMVSTLTNPLIKENCTIDLVSYGYDDSPRHGYIRTSGGSSEEIYMQLDRGINRGVTLVELDATTCTTRNRQRFDTFRWAQARLQVLETMESATAGTIIVGVTADTAEHNDNSSLQNIVGSFFTRYNMNLTDLGFRDKFAFIMQKGYPQKTAFQRKPRYEESLRMAIALRGSTVYDVSFSRV